MNWWAGVGVEGYVAVRGRLKCDDAMEVFRAALYEVGRPDLERLVESVEIGWPEDGDPVGRERGLKIPITRLTRLGESVFEDWVVGDGWAGEDHVTVMRAVRMVGLWAGVEHVCASEMEGRVAPLGTGVLHDPGWECCWDEEMRCARVL